MGTTKTAGMIPKKKSERHPSYPNNPSGEPGGTKREMPEPIMFPTVARACRAPRAGARSREGTDSATKVVAAPNMPPTPSPTKKR